jgi:Amt family ammonium transporter
MLEAGSVREGAISNIIFKNFIDAAIAGLLFWMFGYGLAYGDGKSTTSEEAFLGVGNVALSTMGQDRVFASYESWFFQFTFAATAATIVSGCIAERAKLFGYVIISSILTVWTYPIVVHWVWDTEGWISAFNTEAQEKFGCVRFSPCSSAARAFDTFANSMSTLLPRSTQSLTFHSPPRPPPRPTSTATA